MFLFKDGSSNSGYWTGWSEWETCVVGQNIQTRSRDCETLNQKLADCPFSRLDIRSCSQQEEGILTDFSLQPTDVNFKVNVQGVAHVRECLTSCINELTCVAATFYKLKCFHFSDNSYRLITMEQSLVFLKQNEFVQNVCLKKEYSSLHQDNPLSCRDACQQDTNCIAITFNNQQCLRFNNSFMVDYGSSCLSWLKLHEPLENAHMLLQKRDVNFDAALNETVNDTIKLNTTTQTPMSRKTESMPDEDWKIKTIEKHDADRASWARDINIIIFVLACLLAVGIFFGAWIYCRKR
jgi:hypothetical protein